MNVATQAMFVSCIAGALSFLAPYLAERSDLSSTAVGLIWLVNTVAVVTIQFPVVALMTGRSRVAGLFAASAVLAIALLGYGMAGLFHGITAFAIAAVAAIALAGAECMRAPIQASLFSDIAPVHLIGRYQSLGSMGWQAGELPDPPWRG